MLRMVRSDHRTVPSLQRRQVATALVRKLDQVRFSAPAAGV